VQTRGLEADRAYNFSTTLASCGGVRFLMVFVKNYGYSATHRHLFGRAAAIPLYLLLRPRGSYRQRRLKPNSVKSLLLAEFACACGTIAMGAVLGRLRVYQYALLAALSRARLHAQRMDRS